MSKTKPINAYASTIDNLKAHADSVEGLTLKSDEGHKLRAHLQGLLFNAAEALQSIADVSEKLEEHTTRN